MIDPGNPGKPTGEAGVSMLHRMNESHYVMTGWGLGFLTFKETDQVLDVGCGGGMTLHRIAEKVPKGHLEGIDYSDVSVAESKKLNAGLIAEGRMEIQKASVDSLPFEDNTFDKIVSVESFYFWPDPPENLREVSRVLKTGGQLMLIAEVYNGPALSDHDRENIQNYHLFNPTIEEFRTYFQNAGLSDVQVHTHEGNSWICVEGVKR